MADRNATADDLPDEFDDVDSVIVASALRQAELRVSSVAWGDATSDGQSLLAAHILKSQGLGTSTAPQGPVRSRRVGDVSEDYAVTASASVLGGDLGSTSYGRQFAALKRTVLTFGAGMPRRTLWGWM